MISKQTLLGVGMMAFGGVLLFALAKQPSKDEIATTSDVPAAVKPAATAAPKEDEIARPQSVPLTADVETETRILEQKQKEREARVAQQEQQARELIAKQEKARAAAMAKTEAETEAYNAARANKLKVENRPESAELAKQKIQDEVSKQSDAKVVADKKAQENKAKAEQAKADKTKADVAKKASEKEEVQKSTEKAAKQAVNGKHTVTTGDTLIRLSHQYGVPVSILAEANNMGRHDNLPRGKVLKIPTASEAKKIEAEIKAKAQKAEKEKAEKEKAEKAKAEQVKADKAKADVAKKAESNKAESNKADKPAESKGSAVKGSYVVQVALAADQARADQMAAQYKAAGYKVTTSQTSRGVRVMIGAESTREAADALRDKLKKDGAVNAGNAWVMQAK